MFINPTGFVRFHYSDLNYLDTPGNILNANEWTHVAGTYDGETVKIYINGAVKAETNASIPIPVDTASFVIGGTQDSRDWFAGKIDEVKLYDRGLTEDEVRKSMAGPNIPWEIMLNPGWNLISIGIGKCFYQGDDPPPGQPDCIQKENIQNLNFSNMAEWFTSIVSPAGAWQVLLGPDGVIDSSLPTIFHTLKYVSPCNGYWVKIKGDVNNAKLSINAPIFDPECAIPLKKGWNLIGCPITAGYHDTNTPPDNFPWVAKWVKVNAPVAEEVFKMVDGNYSMILGSDGAYNPELPPVMSSLHHIVPGSGLWINMLEAGNFKYSK